MRLGVKLTLDKFPTCQLRHQRPVGFQKIEARELMGFDPDDLLKGLIDQFSAVGCDAKEAELHFEAVRIGVLERADLGIDVGLNRQLLVQLAPETGLYVFSGFDLPPGKLPLERESAAALALADEHAPALRQNPCGYSNH